MKSTLSSVTTPNARPLRTRRPVARQGAAPAATVADDADAQRALAWLKRGKPQAEIVPDDAVPGQTQTDLKKFRPASYRRGR
jgi:hypothetical protein